MEHKRKQINDCKWQLIDKMYKQQIINEIHKAQQQINISKICFYSISCICQWICMYVHAAESNDEIMKFSTP